ncbi:alpha/beta fold hydrolase [Ciceribacter thiooxidans]|uniref:Alpha/beta fold hydrolase n=1 Tax=Ciceribacter thiooxidans TaxID=1969821 RepID=A0ABV7I5D4_9HYPH|nr:alpha/beta fold hydrolase [Ciceribacter thiooxidans]
MSGTGNPIQILFIQGGGEGTHDAWDDKLVASLQAALGPGYEVLYPRMPDEDDPGFRTWSTAIAAEIARLAPGAILVGHSVGGTIAIHTLAKRPALLRDLAAVFLLAAPYVGDGGWPSDEIDVAPGWASGLSAVPVILYKGDADDTTPMAHADLYARDIPHAKLRRLNGRDHQFNNDLTDIAGDIRQA